MRLMARSLVYRLRCLTPELGGAAVRGNHLRRLPSAEMDNDANVKPSRGGATDACTATDEAVGSTA
jgi:hypothetical protein